MATPNAARHRDLEQRFADLQKQIRDLSAVVLHRRQLSVTDGDFVVSGGGNIIVRDNGAVAVMFPEAIAGDTNSTAAYLGDLKSVNTGEYVGTGIYVTDHLNGAVLNAATGADGLRSSGRFDAHGKSVIMHGEDDATVRGDNVLFLQTAAGGQTQIGLSSASVYIGHSTTGSAANTRLESNGFLARVTSSLRYKANVEPANIDPAKILAVEGRTWQDKDLADQPDAPRHVGFIAEELDAVGLTEFVDYDDEGRPDAIQYDRLSVGLLAVAKAQQAQLDGQAEQIAALTKRLDALEAGA
ncbi:MULTISPECIES: tail fiber domain-containing protein [Nocardioides]|uniref:Tail fiber domain-containing protein n=1 Tax=Nocardioides vastitatis TaxID=2568655 RepID=A0ABW0ZIV7_9ACTN|nr:tail fiber domain-containing protein [Nocardioides sp.]THJ13715.1 tail fiber domain-containing protein [Nocardioides sp.]